MSSPRRYFLSKFKVLTAVMMRIQVLTGSTAFRLINFGSYRRFVYWLDVPGIESRWGARFSSPVQTGSEAHPASYTMGTGSFPGVKRPGRAVDHPPPSSAEVKQRVQLYLYSPSGPSWPVLGWTLPLPLQTLRRIVLPPSSGYISPTLDS